MKRGGIARRTVALTVLVAIVTVLVAGAVAYPLVRSASLSQAEANLTQLADVTAQALERRNDRRPLPRALQQAFDAGQIEAFLVFDSSADVEGISQQDLAQLLAGDSIGGQVERPRGVLLFQGRPLADGSGLVLTQPIDVASADAWDFIARVGIALGVGAVLAVVVGLVMASRISRPLREVRDAADRLASGERDVVVVPQGPAEVADIAHSMNQLAEALLDSEQRQREFLLSVSHELRTPLTAIRGYAEGLADGVIDADQTRGTGGVLMAEGARLDRLVTDLLDLARLGAVDFRVHETPTDIATVVRDTAHVWTDRCAPHQVDLTVESDATELPVITDPMRVRQILDNLLENALRMSPKGSKIDIRVSSRENGVRISVRDHGPGLTDDDRRIAFEPGVLHERYRSERPVGTGIGLALVGRLASRLGGEAGVESPEDGGARFWVELPRRTGGTVRPTTLES